MSESVRHATSRQKRPYWGIPPSSMWGQSAVARCLGFQLPLQRMYLTDTVRWILILYWPLDRTLSAGGIYLCCGPSERINIFVVLSSWVAWPAMISWVQLAHCGAACTKKVVGTYKFWHKSTPLPLPYKLGQLGYPIFVVNLLSFSWLGICLEPRAGSLKTRLWTRFLRGLKLNLNRDPSSLQCASWGTPCHFSSRGSLSLLGYRHGTAARRLGRICPIFIYVHFFSWAAWNMNIPKRLKIWASPEFGKFVIYAG